MDDDERQPESENTENTYALGVAARRPGNWVLRAGPEVLYVKLRRFTDDRLPAELWIKAHIRRCIAEGIPATVARRGEAKTASCCG